MFVSVHSFVFHIFPVDQQPPSLPPPPVPPTPSTPTFTASSQKKKSPPRFPSHVLHTLRTPPLHVMSLPNGQIRRRPSSLEQHPSRSGEDARPHRRSASFEKRDPFSSPDIYYGDEDALRKQFVGWSGRAISSVSKTVQAYIMSRRMLKSTDHQSVGQSWIHCLEGQYSRSQTKPW